MDVGVGLVMGAEGCVCVGGGGETTPVKIARRALYAFLTAEEQGVSS